MKSRKGMFSNAKVADGANHPELQKNESEVPAATSSGIRLRASLLVKDINHLVEKTFASFYDRQPVLSNRAGSLILGSLKSQQQQSLGKISDVVIMSRLEKENI